MLCRAALQGRPDPSVFAIPCTGLDFADESRNGNIAAQHDYLRTVIVAPMTTGSRPTAFRIPITFEVNSGLILFDQIRTLDKQRLVTRLGAVRAATLAHTLATLQDLFTD